MHQHCPSGLQVIGAWQFWQRVSISYIIADRATCGGVISPVRPGRCRKACGLNGAFDYYCGAVSQNFRDALHHFISVVADSDYSVSSVLRCVLHHQFQSLFARLFAHVGIERDVPTDDRLQRCADGAKSMLRERTTIPRTMPKLRTRR